MTRKVNRLEGENPHLTTAEAGKMLGFSPQKMNKLVDTGLLTGHRIPHSRHRRVTLRDLRKFAAEHGIPLNPLRNAV